MAGLGDLPATFGVASSLEDAERQPSILDKLANALGHATWKSLATPRAQMQPNPYPPRSEEASWYEDQKARTAQNWGPEMALNMVGSPALAGGLPGTVGSGIKAYHGSPHDFDKFDLKQIGTGEGAQAYGHGLYFAESEPTARFYRENLTRDRDRALESGGTLPAWVARTIESRDQNAIGEMRRTFQSRLAEARKQLADPNTVQPWMIEANIPGFKQTLKAIDDYAAGAQLKPSGHMYEVNINADPAKMLDWDKPIPTKHALRGMIADKALANTGSVYADVRNAGKDAFLSAQRPELTGEGAYRSLVRASLDKPRGEAVPYVSSMLNEAGIPGIKYLDQGSRTAGAGSSNYVVFDDKLIDILRKYGLAGVPAAGAVGAAVQQPQQVY